MRFRLLLLALETALLVAEVAPFLICGECQARRKSHVEVLDRGFYVSKGQTGSRKASMGHLNRHSAIQK